MYGIFNWEPTHFKWHTMITEIWQKKKKGGRKKSSVLMIQKWKWEALRKEHGVKWSQSKETGLPRLSWIWEMYIYVLTSSPLSYFQYCYAYQNICFIHNSNKINITNSTKFEAVQK